MSFAVHSNYNSALSQLNQGYKSVSDYSKYLKNKFQCLTPGQNASVTVSPGLMRKAMSDEKISKWLEKELSSIPDTIRAAQRAAIGHGSRLESVSIEYTEDCTIMKTSGVFGESGTDTEIDKWLKKIEEDRQEKKLKENKEDIKEQTMSLVNQLPKTESKEEIGFDTYA